MSHRDQDIPTLTDFIRTGDEDMHHHFDAHQFSIDQDEVWAKAAVDAFNENAFYAEASRNVDLADDKADSKDPVDSDPLQIAAVEIDQVPAELAPFDPALVEDDTATDETDEYLELDVQEVISPAMPSMGPTEDEYSQRQTPAATEEAIRQQIEQAVDELLPGIAEQLKQNLYRRFRCQRNTD